MVGGHFGVGIHEEFMPRVLGRRLSARLDRHFRKLRHPGLGMPGNSLQIWTENTEAVSVYSRSMMQSRIVYMQVRIPA